MWGREGEGGVGGVEKGVGVSRGRSREGGGEWVHECEGCVWARDGGGGRGREGWQ